MVYYHRTAEICFFKGQFGEFKHSVTHLYIFLFTVYTAEIDSFGDTIHMDALFFSSYATQAWSSVITFFAVSET